MGTNNLSPFKKLEGHRVGLELTDGRRLNDVEVVSAGRGGLTSLWLDAHGVDLFIEKGDVLEVWPAA